MENRKFISAEGINSRTDGSGTITAHWLHGEKTKLFFKGSSQGPQRINGYTYNRMTVGVNFLDTGPDMMIKFTDKRGDLESLLVQYALDVMEDDTYEEFYKAILMLTKVHLEKTIESGREWLNKYYRGEYAWPITSLNFKDYERYNEQYVRAHATLDVTTADLKYFAQYEREGVQSGDKRFDY
jgi:hypothetical protein